MSKASFTLHEPSAWTTPVVFASPHSGRTYPRSFLRRSVLDELTIRSSEDAFVDLLFSDVTSLGAPLLTASAPRAYVDLNRSPDELDPALIEDVRKVSHNPRVSSGLGVIPRVVANGRAIYRGKLPLREAEERIAEVWRPYHACLQTLLVESQQRFGQALLIDCHSMPHEAIETLGSGSRRPDVVIGDRFGAAASAEIVERIEAAFVRAGLRVQRNTPFAGAYITQHYGRPSRGQHAVQIEIDRRLYMNEMLVRQNLDFGAFKALLDHVAADICEAMRPAMPLAAE